MANKLGPLFCSCIAFCLLFSCLLFSCSDDDASDASAAPGSDAAPGSSMGAPGSSGSGDSEGLGGSRSMGMDASSVGPQPDAEVPAADAGADAAIVDEEDAGATTTSCDDDNACTVDSKAQNGTCAHTDVVCAALDACHDAGSCDPGTGACSNPDKTNGSDCDDGDACTQADSCQSGVCSAGTPVVCTASDQCHDAGTCDPQTGECSNPATNDATNCDDDDACTQLDICLSGVCTGGTPVVCTASDQCHDAGTCDPQTGQCSNPATNDATNCDDDDACTQLDICLSGVCTGGNPVTCPTPDQCHNAGTCDPANGLCSNPAKDDNTGCDDADACTQSDSCQSGVCTGASPVVCPTPDQCHNAGTCDPANGMCSNPAKDDNTACDDTNACSTPDTCQSGVCTGPNTCPTTILSEDFQSQAFPVDWFRFNVDNRTPAGAVSYVNNAWIVREDFANDVADYAAFSTSWYSPAGAADDWMVTKAITLPPAGGGCTLKWNAITYDSMYPDGYQVRIFTAAPVQATLVASSTQLFSIVAENTNWTPRSLDLSAYQGQTVYLAWRNPSNDQFLLLIDDIVVTCL